MKRLAIILATTALAGCVGQPCEWDPRWEDSGACFITEGNGGDDVPDAPAAPEPDPEPEPQVERETPTDVEANASKASRPAPPPTPETPTNTGDDPEPEPEPHVEVEPEPEPEKPQYSDWSHPGDEENFKGYPPEVVAEKKMNLAAARAAADAAHNAEHGKAGGSER